MNTNFLKALYTALWFETGGLFDPKDEECINGTNRAKCGTSGGRWDRGGNTKFGIAANSHVGVDIDHLTLAQAAEIYKKEYWDPCHCDELPPLVAAYVFDVSCGSGDGVAEKTLQRALSVVPDGIIGSGTLAAAAKLPQEVITERMRVQRHAFFEGIALRDPTQKRYLPGWFRRADTYFDVYRKYAS